MSLGRYFKRVFQWWWLVILSTGIAAGMSYFVTSQQPKIYEVTVQLRVGQDVTQLVNPGFQDFTIPDQLAGSYARLVHQYPLLQAVIESLNLQISWDVLQGQVTAIPVQGTQLLVITVWDISPDRAVAIADEIARQLILQSPTSPDNEARKERGDFVKGQLDDLESKIQVAKAQLEELRAEQAKTFSARQLQDIQNQMNSLEGLITTWQGNYTNLLRLLEGTDSPNFLAIVEPAQLPTAPVRPNILLNVILAAAAGFALSVAAALLIEYLDNTIRSVDDLKLSLGVNVLGSVSRMKGVGYQDKLVTNLNSFSSITEAYRLMRTNVQLITADLPNKSIVVTSSNPGEGKSITVANLGVMMAQAGFKTVIVDADLRRPALHKIFQLSNSEGLTDLLGLPEFAFDNYLLKNVGVENLRIITSGPLPANPAELLNSPRVIELLHHLAKSTDVIILDSSPVLAVTDAIVLAHQVSNVILVVEAGRTRRPAVRQALERLHRSGAQIIGGVLNRAGRNDGTYARYVHYAHGTHDLPDQRGATLRGWRQWLSAFK